MARACHTRPSRLLDKARVVLSLNQTDDDNFKLLALTLVNRVDKAVAPLSLGSLRLKKFYLLSIGGENAYLTRRYALLLERFNDATDYLYFLEVSRAGGPLRNKLLPMSNIDEVMQCRDIVLLGTNSDSQR